jgi:hypothetical protein
LIDKINPTFIDLTATAIHHCLSPWNTGQFRITPEFGPGGGVQRKCNTRTINHLVNNACTDDLRRLDEDFRSSSPEVQAKTIDNISSMIRRRIHSPGTDPVMGQLHNNQGSVDEEFLEYVPEELIEHPHNPFNHLSSFVAATEASMRFSAVLPAITSSSQPVPCSNSNSNSNNIANMTSVENTGLVIGSKIAEGEMSLGG